MFKFLHAADAHLDSPLRGIARYEGMPVDEIRQATRRAFDNLVKLAISERVRFVLLAGDLYDGDWKDTSTGMFFVSRMSRLREAGIPVYLISGNHDAASKMTRSLRLPENVFRFSTKSPETRMLPEGDVAIHGQSFATQSVLENLAARYPARAAGCFNIGILHTSLSGYEGHEPYAPCSLDDLRGKEYDYWALGHVHIRQELSLYPRVVFPGNIQGRNIRETGAKGCTLVTVGESQEILECLPMTLDVIRWERVAVNINGAETMEQVQDRAGEAIRSLIPLGEDRPVVARIEFEGRTSLHGQLAAGNQWREDLRALATDVSGEMVWIEKIEVRTTTPREQSVAVGPLAEIHESARNLAPEAASEAIGPLLAKLPDEAKQEVKSWIEPGSEGYRRLLAEAEALLMERLSGDAG